MYKILLFSGGVYKFELLVEYIEDIGGLVVQEDRLHITRGNYFLSEEIRVMLIVPHTELSNVSSFANGIKGSVEELIIEKPLENKLINSLELYNILCKADDWIDQDALSNIIEHYIRDGYIKIETPTNFPEFNLDNCLEFMLSLKLIKKRENDGIIEYHH